MGDKPAKSFRSKLGRPISISAWLRGGKAAFGFSRFYRDKGGQFHTSFNFFPEDMLALKDLIDEALTWYKETKTNYDPKKHDDRIKDIGEPGSAVEAEPAPEDYPTPDEDAPF